MTIAEAIRAASDEYTEECRRSGCEAAFNQLMEATIGAEYQEIDKELPSYVGDILGALGFPNGPVDGRYYQMARMVFRMGMRTQRKLARPDQATTMFWRSDQKEQ